MKILYFGTVCDIDEYEKKISDCKFKPSVAPIVFESSLLTGFKENGAEIDIYSFPMIPVFPKSELLMWGKKKESLECGYDCTWLPTVNLPFIKQFVRKICGRRALKRWLKSNHNRDCVVLTYSVPPFLVKDLIGLCNKYAVKCYAVIPDLPDNMYMNAKNGKFIFFLKKRYLSAAIRYQSSYDGYIYLTEAMKDVVAPQKPYMVMEGIADIHAFDNIPSPADTGKKIIMYAGGLHAKYGVINLMDAFEMARLDDAELWIFGRGSAEKEILNRCRKNSNIRFWGQCKREQVLDCERQADLLVNPRGTNDAYTKYSFPSKTIEYMLSGTPLLTTELPGIPNEYFRYVFHISNNDAETIAGELTRIFNLSEACLCEMGINAKEYIVNSKNSRVQVKRILDFFDFKGCS